jgi:replicative DNA helicase
VGLALVKPTYAVDLDIEPWHFGDPRWAKTWGAVREMHLAGEPVDEVTVARKLEAGGSSAVLSELIAATLEMAVSPERYAEIVRESWVTRQVTLAASSVLTAQRDGVSGDDLLSLALSKLSGIEVGQTGKAKSISQLVRERFVELAQLAERKAKGESAVTGIPTGIDALDAMLGGLQRGICTVVAARPGMGKSAFGMAVGSHAAAQDIGVHVFNMEDGESAYADRALSRTSLVPAQNLRTCDLVRGDLTNLAAAADVLGRLPRWLVDDRGGLTAEELVRSVRRDLRDNKTQLVIVDYVQLLHGPRGVDRTEAANHAMGVLADSAKQDGIAYLVMAQLNRECERRDNKRPILSDLKQSGAIEERSKAVLMLYRPYLYREKDKKTGQPFPEDRIEILVRKQNHGQMGRVIATWHGPTTRIE